MQEEAARLKEEEEERANPMQALEKRTNESRREMEKIEHLEELKDLNKRHASVDHDSIISKHFVRNYQRQIHMEDEEKIQYFHYLIENCLILKKRFLILKKSSQPQFLIWYKFFSNSLNFQKYQK